MEQVPEKKIVTMSEKIVQMDGNEHERILLYMFPNILKMNIVQFSGLEVNVCFSWLVYESPQLKVQMLKPGTAIPC